VEDCRRRRRPGRRCTTAATTSSTWRRPASSRRSPTCWSTAGCPAQPSCAPTKPSSRHCAASPPACARWWRHCRRPRTASGLLVAAPHLVARTAEVAVARPGPKPRKPDRNLRRPHGLRQRCNVIVVRKQDRLRRSAEFGQQAYGRVCPGIVEMDQQVVGDEGKVRPTSHGPSPSPRAAPSRADPPCPHSALPPGTRSHRRARLASACARPCPRPRPGVRSARRSASRSAAPPPAAAVLADMSTPQRPASITHCTWARAASG